MYRAMAPRAFFAKKLTMLRTAGFVFEEDRRDDLQSQGVGIDGREILDRRAIDQGVSAERFRLFVQCLGQPRLPHQS
jgi:hypothetical protein